MARRDQPLYRDTTDKMLGGVCSGLAHYFDIDTTLVRVAFVVLALFGGGGVLAYLILWALLDPAPPPAPPASERTAPEITRTVEPELVPDATESEPVADAAPEPDLSETAPANPAPATEPEPPSPTTR